MKYLLLPTFCLLICFTTHGQSDAPYEISPDLKYDNLNLYIYPQIGVPSKDFRKAVHNKMGDLGFGLSAGFLVNPFMNKRPSPVFLGLDLGWLTYGVDKIKENGDIPPVKTTFNIYNVNAIGRLMLTQHTRFAPFIDGSVGMKVFNTRTKIDKDLVDTILNDKQTTILDTTNDTGLNYSVGIGFYIRRDFDKDIAMGESFSVRLLYVWGDDVNYVKRNSISVDQDLYVTYETGYARSDMFLIQFGFNLYQ